MSCDAAAERGRARLHGAAGGAAPATPRVRPRGIGLLVRLMAGVAVDLAVGAREWQALCVRESVYSCGPWLAPMAAADLDSDQSRPSADQVRGVEQAAALRPTDGLGAFGWLSNMGVVLLEGGGSLCYSPVLHPDGPEALVAALRQIGALPVRIRQPPITASLLRACGEAKSSKIKSIKVNGK